MVVFLINSQRNYQFNFFSMIIVSPHSFQVNAVNKYKRTPIILAANGGFGDIVTILAENGANVNEKQHRMKFSCGCIQRYVVSDAEIAL